ncbi:putative tetratricopeptide-like helical domain superfamily [Helianthus annuus]|nr:putative tetratricopeptide-like helical domain superfamily [Helianthus annuus]KAJ0656490.1 putative tetratricopeptide-like helical domain superfamily [Helianthus annuus]KAJ0840589.1 putative tetratricopeptide-like helical domain superfamily [Helianthus annuus]
MLQPLLRRIINPNIKLTHSLDNIPRFLNCISKAAEEEEKTAAAITVVCKSFPNNLNWQTLNRNLKETDIRNSSIINRVLIQLKDPPNAKKALSFFHWSSHFTNITHQTHTYALVIHILVKAKLIKDASALIESVLTRSVTDNGVLPLVHSFMNSYEVTGSSPFVFDVLVQICSKLRMIDEAIDVCVCVGEHGFRLNVISYNTLLHVIQKSDKTELVWRVYEHMIENRTYPNEKSVEIMVDALCKEGKLKKFVDMIDRIDRKRCSPKVIVNTCLVFRMIDEGRIKDGLLLLKRMLIKNMILDTISCSLIVYGKIKLGELETAWKVYDEMVMRGFKANSFVHTSFIGAYCEAGKVENAGEVFNDMERDGLQVYDETYMHMIVGCSKAGKVEESLNFCERMLQNGFILSCLAFNEVIERLNGHESVRRADDVLTLLLDKGFMPDANTYSYIIEGYGREGDVEGVIKLYYEMEYRKLSPGASVFTWLIVSLYRAGRLEESKKYMRIMKARSLVPLDYTYDAFIFSHRMDKNTKPNQCQSCS